MKETNKKIIITLMMIILVLSVFYMLALTGSITLKPEEKCISQPQEIENKTYTYEEMKGLYSYTGETENDGQGNEYRISADLYLYGNGTYRYINYTNAPHGHIGNYIIVDNKIVLNYLYRTGSGTGITATKETSEITINSKEELLLSENIGENKIEINLTKNNNDEKIKEFEKTTVNDLIEQEEKMNQAAIKNN